MNHEEDEFPSFGDYFPSLLGFDEGYVRLGNFLGYPLELFSQSNNDTTMSKFIHSMAFLHIWLTQKNITNFKWGNITHYNIFEELDVVR